MSEAMKALLAYHQADEDGVMVLTSRQAIHEVAAEMQQSQDALRHANVTLLTVLGLVHDEKLLKIVRDDIRRVEAARGLPHIPGG